MGFYSIYKVIKDIIKTLFGIRAFKIFLIMLICCVVYNIFNPIKSNAAGIMPIDMVLEDGYRTVGNNYTIKLSGEDYLISYTFYTNKNYTSNKKGKVEGQFLFKKSEFDDSKDYAIAVNPFSNPVEIYKVYCKDDISITTNPGYKNGTELWGEVSGKIYDYDTNSFSKNLNTNYYQTLTRGFQPNNVLFVHNVSGSTSTLWYGYSDCKFPYVTVQNTQTFIEPKLLWDKDKNVLIVRLYDFIDKNGVKYGSRTFDNELSSIKLSAYSGTVGTLLYSTVDLLTYGIKYGTPYDEDYDAYIEVPIEDLNLSEPSKYMTMTFSIHSTLSHLDFDYINADEKRQLSWQFLTDFEGQNYWHFNEDGTSEQVDDKGEIVFPDNPGGGGTGGQTGGSSTFDDSNIVAGLGGVQNSVDNMTNSVDNMNGFLQNGDMSGDDLNIDSNYNLDTNENPNDVLSSILDKWKETLENANNSNPVEIVIPLPFSDRDIHISSDIISSHIEGSVFYTIIQTIWYAAFGWFFLMFAKRTIEFFSSGEFLEGGGKLSKFSKYLDDNNTIIKSNMM